MIVKTGDHPKWEEKNEDESYFVKTGEHIPTGLGMSICYLKDM